MRLRLSENFSLPKLSTTLLLTPYLPLSDFQNKKMRTSSPIWNLSRIANRQTYKLGSIDENKWRQSEAGKAKKSRRCTRKNTMTACQRNIDDGRKNISTAEVDSNSSSEDGICHLEMMTKHSLWMNGSKCTQKCINHRMMKIEDYFKDEHSWSYFSVTKLIYTYIIYDNILCNTIYNNSFANITYKKAKFQCNIMCGLIHHDAID